MRRWRIGVGISSTKIFDQVAQLLSSRFSTKHEPVPEKNSNNGFDKDGTLRNPRKQKPMKARKKVRTNQKETAENTPAVTTV